MKEYAMLAYMELLRLRLVLPGCCDIRLMEACAPYRLFKRISERAGAEVDPTIALALRKLGRRLRNVHNELQACLCSLGHHRQLLTVA